MPRHYQIKSDCMLPHNVYMQVVYIIKDYHRMLKERDNIMFGTVHTEGPRGPGIGDPTANRAIKLAALSNRVDGIDAAIHDTNAKYNNKVKRVDIAGFDTLAAFSDYGCYCYYLQDPATGKEPSYRTWNYFRSAVAYKIAENLKLI